ncbi:MAG: asparagine synthase-related protein [Bacteroidota bacterium]
MSGICGIFYKKKHSFPDSQAGQMLDKLDPGHRYAASKFIRETITMGVLTRQKPMEGQHGGFLMNECCVCDVNLHNRLELKNRLKLAENVPDEFLIKTGYDAWNTDLPVRLRGEFAFALYHQRNETVFAARDRVGIKPFYYVDNAVFFAWASSIPPLLALPGVGKSMDEEWLLDLLSNNISDKDKTHFSDIKRLKPGHWIEVTASKTTIKKYWDLTPMDLSGMDDETMIAEFRHLLSLSITNSLVGSAHLGCELSGGLDSSSIASLASIAAKESGVRFSTYSHVNPDYSLFPFKDERDQIREVNQCIHNDNVNIIDATGRGIFDALKFGLKVQGGPTQQRFYEFSDALYEKAAGNGVETLLSGFGGDEMVTSHAAGYFHELAATSYGRFLKELFASRKSWQGKINNLALLTIYAKLPWIYHWWATVLGKERKRLRYVLHHSAIQKELIRKYKMIDRSLEKSRFPNQTSVADRQYSRVMHPHVSQRLEYSAQAARYFGIEYRYPLLDADLLQFYYSLPSHLKFKNQTPRFVMREAMKGLLPESIRLRQDKSGATIPSVHSRYRKDYPEILQFLEKCRNKGVASQFISHDAMINWAKKIHTRSLDGPPVYQGMFFNYLMLLMYNENQK